MKNLILIFGLTFGLFFIISCSKETLIKKDIETGMLCDIEYEIKYSEWCIDKNLKYHIGHPNITCFDSMLISFPLINNIINQYGNYPKKSTYLFSNYFETLDVYRIENFDCEEGGEKITYRMFIEKNELLNPSQVDVLFYFYTENEPYPTDSLVVEFKPWN